MDYSIRPLCFSHVDLPREFFGGVPIHSGEGVSASPMIYVLLSGQDEAGVVHHYLVDAGFHAEKWIHRFGFYDWESPEAVLAKVGVQPEQIEKVFLTHMHFDHANNVGAFPNADVYVQWEEYRGWLQALSNVLPLRHLNDGMLAVMVRGDGPASVLPQLGILLAFAVVLAGAAAMLFKWDDV